MKIVIIGVGKVGTVLTEYLVQEGHNVNIIDINASLVDEYVNIYDVRGVVGNGASYEIQLEAEANEADVLIATAASDELNILCCLVGRKNGVKHTIARIRNPEYAKQVDFMNKELGLSMIVNPELEAANELMQMLSFPASTKIEYFADGQAEIVELKLNSKSCLVGESLEQIRKLLNVRFLVAAVERNGIVHIPSGSFVLEENDRIFITSSPKEIDKFFKNIGILKQKAKNVMIIGGGKISYYLAKSLIQNNAKVKILEIDKDRCYELSEMLPEAAIINADGTNQDNLLEEGINGVDALVTLTGFDEENIIISLFAEMMKVPKVITKINHYSYSNILKNVGLESTISPKALTANLILRYVRSLTSTFSQVKTLYKFLDNKIEATEFYIPNPTEYTNITFRDLNLKTNSLVACLIRNNKVIIPNGNDWIEPGDSVVVVTTIPHLSDFKDIIIGS